MQSYLVDDGVPVERLVLLHVPRHPVRLPHVLVVGVRPHGARRHGAEEPVDVVTEVKMTNMSRPLIVFPGIYLEIIDF